MASQDATPTHRTFLSPKVHHLICEAGAKSSCEAETRCLLSDGLLDWDTLTKMVLEEEIDTWHSKTDFVDIVGRLAPLCDSIHRGVMSLLMNELEERYITWFQWTGCSQVFLAGFKVLLEDDSRGPSLCLLLTTSALERALGDVYLMRSSPCPYLLKDLLVTPELQELFGIPALFCLRILMGPPTSLNLRNVLWHGFAAPGEIPARYASFFLVLVASLGHKLHTQGILSGDIQHRTQMDFCKQTERIREAFPDTLPGDICQLNTCTHIVAAVCQTQVPMWNLAMDFYKSKRYGWCVAIISPLLEHVIRMIFASVNQCPDRVLTAESSVLFTTFDEMLSSELPDGNPNQLITAISESIMNLLMDLLVHSEGTRLRDHISHGEVDLQNVSPGLASYTVFVFVACCMKAVEIMKPHSREMMHPLLGQISDCAERYRSVFHPLASCKYQVTSLLSSLEGWSCLPRPSPASLDYTPWEVECGEHPPSDHHSDGATELISLITRCLPCWKREDDVHVTKCITSPLSSMEPLQHHLQGVHLETLFRPRREMELVGLLLHIVGQCLQVVKQTRHIAALRFDQWRSKQLRSRQRTNYIRFLNRLPRIGTGLRFTLLLLITHLSTINQVSHLPSAEFQAKIKFLKAILQYTENLTTQTGIDRNRWDESAQLTDSVLQRIREFYCKTHGKTEEEFPH